MTITGSQAQGTQQASATFTIAPGFTNVQITLASYTKPPPALVTTFPQTLFAASTGFFSTGTHRLTVALPTPCGFWQADLVRGPPLQTITSLANGYSAQGRLLAAALGGSPACAQERTPGFWKNWASCSASNGNQAFVLDRILATTRGILIGDLLVDTCLEAVRLLDKSTVNTATKMASHPAYNLAAHLLAARLNLANGASACATVLTAANSAQALLDAIGFTGVGAPAMTTSQGTTANQLATTLDRYNNGLVC